MAQVVERLLSTAKQNKKQPYSESQSGLSIGCFNVANIGYLGDSLALPWFFMTFCMCLGGENGKRRKQGALLFGEEPRKFCFPLCCLAWQY
jgi:hypothetical protein